MDRLRSFLNLERGEEVPVFLLFSYLTLTLTCYMITKAARDGIFLHKFSAMTLPYVYIGIAAVIGFIVAAYIRISSRISQTWLISGSLLFFVANLLLLWWVVRVEWTPAPWIFYVWTSIFGIIITTQVWTVANSVLDLRQAKRVFPLVSSGGILGGAAGGLIGARLVKSIGTDNLMLTLIPLLLLVVVIVQVLTRRYTIVGQDDPPGTASGKPKKDFLAVAKKIRATPYLRLIVGVLALSAIVTLIVDFQFKVVVQSVFRTKDQITAFVAAFSAYLSMGAFVLQVIAGSRIVKTLGMRVTLFILPVAITAGTAALIAFPLALWAGGVLKGSDYVPRYSVDRATTELLYVPVPQSIKTEVKAIIDMIIQRLADGMGGLLLLLVTRLLHQGQVGVSVFNLMLLGGWFWVAFRTRQEYVGTLRRIIEREDIPKTIIDQLIGPRSIATLRTMLKSKDTEIVLSGMETAVAMGHPEWIPRELISHPSPKVRDKAIEIVSLTERELRERVQAETNSTVGASAIIRIVAATDPVRRMTSMSQFLQDPALKVRLSAVVGLARQRVGNEVEKGTIRKVLEQITAGLDANSIQWKDVAEALGDIAHPEAIDLHVRLLQHPDRAVKKQAILSAGRAGHRELVPFLVPLLVDGQWAPEARNALREYGPRILGTLSDIFSDLSADLEIRRNIPLVLAYIPQQASVEILLDGLFAYDGLLRYRAIRALGKLRLLDPDLRFSPEKVNTRIREDCESIMWFQQALAKLYAKEEGNDLLLQLFKDKISRGKDRVFRLLALRLPPTAAIGSLLALAKGERLTIAAVAEYLDNVLPGKVKDVVLAVIEGKVKLPKQSVRQILEACLRNPDPILRECAADALAKNRWPDVAGLTPPLTQLKKGLNYG